MILFEDTGFAHLPKNPLPITLPENRIGNTPLPFQEAIAKAEAIVKPSDTAIQGKGNRGGTLLLALLLIAGFAGIIYAARNAQNRSVPAEEKKN